MPRQPRGEEGSLACLEEDTGRSSLLDDINSPADLRKLSVKDCDRLAEEIRSLIVEVVTRTGGHLGSNLGSVELTLALHRVFDSPADALLFDTGHQAYTHKLVTGRREAFVAGLRQQDGLSGYPNRTESVHDHIENSHASTALSYAHGLAKSFELTGETTRRVVAVVGDGALTGGLAYEALNNLGHSGARVLIVLNDNGRSYAPTVSKLSGSLTQLRLDPRFTELRDKVARAVRELPVMGGLAETSYRGVAAALREIVEPHVFFEALGVRYTGPIDGHDIAGLEQALRRASSFRGPIVLHVLTKKGKGYAPAEMDEVQCLHDFKVAAAHPTQAASPLGSPGAATDTGALRPVAVASGGGESFGDAFSQAILAAGAKNERLVAITAAMPGPTGLLAFSEHFPDRYLDVGIAEAHAVVAAAGLAMGGMTPVVAVYSTFFSRAFDQANLDVALHRLPVVFCLDRAGVTGDDGASHHGLFDLVLGLCIPEMAILCPSSADEIAPMLKAALSLNRPALIRWPKTPSLVPLAGESAGPLSARLLREGDGSVVLIGIGKLAHAGLYAAEALSAEGTEVTCYDPRLVRPADPEMIAAAARAELVVTAEDGLATGGAGAYICQLVRDEARRQGLRLPDQLNLGMPTAFVPQAKPDAILSAHGLDGEGIAASLRDALEHTRATRGAWGAWAREVAAIR
jgi:1-deoxy-D-xylulose-5-phosphate synthase